MRSRCSGFTLLEVLIAIVITALIGLGSWQLLNSAIRTNEITQKRIDAFSELQRAVLFIKRDLQQFATRAVRDEYGDYLPALSTRNQFYALELTRSGWRNPLQDLRSDIQRVAFELEGDVLMRHYWQVLDRAQDSQPISRELLSGVESLTIRFLNEAGRWSNQWPPDSIGNNAGGDDEEGAKDTLKPYNQSPRAIEFSFKHQQFGDIVLLSDVTSYLENDMFPEKTSGGNGSGNGNGNINGNGSGGGNGGSEEDEEETPS